MPSILLCSTPMAGHLRPLVALGAALRERGWLVTMLTGAKFADLVARNGLDFVPIPPSADYDDARMNDEFPGRARQPGFLRSRFDLQHVFVGAMADQHTALRTALATNDFDVVMAENLFLGIVPWVTSSGRTARACAVYPTPCMLRSVDTAPFGPGIAPAGGTFGRVRNRIMHAAVEHVVLRRAQATATAIAGAGAPFVLDWPLRADDVFLLSVPSLEYPRAGFDERLRYVGRIPESASSADVPPWWSRLDEGAPVVVVTQGTLDNEDLGQLIHPTLDALAGTDVLVVVTTGGRDLRVDAPNVVVADYVPYDLLLPRAAALVTNGGWGGVNAALRQGVPLVVSGNTEDKAEVAARVARSGAGIRLRRARARWIARAVRRVLAEPSYRTRAGAIADEFARRDTAALIDTRLRTGLAVTP